MDAETRAALEWAIGRLKHGASRAALGPPYGPMIARLQALLDGKPKCYHDRCDCGNQDEQWDRVDICCHCGGYRP